MIVIWNDNECIIPNIGYATKGEPIEMPEDVARYFLKSGRAIEGKSKKSKAKQTPKDAPKTFEINVRETTKAKG